MLKFKNYIMVVSQNFLFKAKMKNFLILITLFIFKTSPLFGQSPDEKSFSFRTALFINALTYNLNSQNAFGLHLGQIPPTEINVNNVEKLEKNFYGLNYAHGFNCLNCDSYFVVVILSNGNSIITTDDGSTYTYSGLGLGVLGGYSWYFNNDISIILGTGPVLSNEKKEGEDLKSDKGFGTDADERIEKLNFLPLVPLLFVGFSF